MWINPVLVDVLWCPTFKRFASSISYQLSFMTFLETPKKSSFQCISYQVPAWNIWNTLTFAHISNRSPQWKQKLKTISTGHPRWCHPACPKLQGIRRAFGKVGKMRKIRFGMYTSSHNHGSQKWQFSTSMIMGERVIVTIWGLPKPYREIIYPFLWKEPY